MCLFSVLSTQTVELEEAVNVSLGRHLLLNCNTGASHDPRHIAWKKDGDILSTIEIAEVYIKCVLISIRIMQHGMVWNCEQKCT